MDRGNRLDRVAGGRAGPVRTCRAAGVSDHQLVLAPTRVLDLVLGDLVVHHPGGNPEKLGRLLLHPVVDAQGFQDRLLLQLLEVDPLGR